MDVAVSIEVNEKGLMLLESLLDETEYFVQLAFATRNSAKEWLPAICEIFNSREAGERLFSVRGPLYPGEGSTLFEDTVFVVSELEDNVSDAAIAYVTTPAGSHIRELCDFYRDDKIVNIITGEVTNPIEAAFTVDSLMRTEAYYDIGLSYAATELSSVFMDPAIISPLSSLISEVLIDPARKPDLIFGLANWVPIIEKSDNVCCASVRFSRPEELRIVIQVVDILYAI